MSTRGLLKIGSMNFYIESDAYPSGIVPRLKQIIEIARRNYKSPKNNLQFNDLIALAARERFSIINRNQISNSDFDYMWKINRMGNIELIDGGYSYRDGDSKTDVEKFHKELQRLHVKY